MKVCCYTCITGGYDSLKPLACQQSGDVDFLCFTDDPTLAQLDWKVFQMPSELNGLSKVKQQRVIKICPHKWLPDGYDASIWIDGSFQVVGDIMKFVSQYDLVKTPLYTRVHPHRNCIYEEAKTCISLKKDSREVIEDQVKRYQAEGYPEKVGMAETGILLRKHNDRRCQLLGNLWASEILRGSCRDQLSFNYACWKMHFLPGCLNNEFKATSNQTFKLKAHGRFEQ